ncbi:AAA domain-containing protein [Psidium guajava]|nr:AAA domain-containing protein [Psidium guajava]
MPREIDPIWRRVKLVEGTNKWKCRYCDKDFFGSATRVKAHLAGVSSLGIRRCDKANENVRAEASTAIKAKSAPNPSHAGGTSGEGTGRTGSDAAATHPLQNLILPPGEASLDDADDAEHGSDAAATHPQYHLFIPPNEASLDHLLAADGNEITLLPQQSLLDWLDSHFPL